MLSIAPAAPGWQRRANARFPGRRATRAGDRVRGPGLAPGNDRPEHPVGTGRRSTDMPDRASMTAALVLERGRPGREAERP